MKLAMWLLLAVVVWWAWRKQQGTSAPDTRAPAPSAGAGTAVEAMLRCPHCGVHFPASEAVRDARGTAYCCEEHLHALT